MIPENWRWVPQNTVCRLSNGEKRENESYPYWEAKALRGTKAREYADSGRFVKKGTKVILVDGENSGEVFDIAEDGYMGSTFRALSIEDTVLPEYLRFFILLNKDVYRNNKRGTAIPHLDKKLFFSTLFPLPPFPEQERIAMRIESLFAKLDEAAEKLQTVVDSYELRRAAILHRAFTGELTAKWREDHGRIIDDWENCTFDTCVMRMQNGLAKRKGSVGEKCVVLRLANLNEDGFDTSDLREIILDEKERKVYTLLENDVIMIRVNGSKENVGRQLLVPKGKKWAFCDHIIRIQYQEKVLPQYMVLFSKSEDYRLYVKDNMVSSAGQNTISRKGMANLVVPVPPSEEQTEIVSILNSILFKEREIHSAAQAALSQIPLIKKAILARAFRGELGTNDPAEERPV